MLSPLLHPPETADLLRTCAARAGDIPDEWIRDSSVQLGVYLPRISAHPAFRAVVEGAIRTQAFFILQDPWANSYTAAWRARGAWPPEMQRIGRGGWVASRNFELDSGAYFMHLLANYVSTPGIYDPSALLRDTRVHDAVLLMLKVWQIEQVGA